MVTSYDIRPYGTPGRYNAWRILALLLRTRYCLSCVCLACLKYTVVVDDKLAMRLQPRVEPHNQPVEADGQRALFTYSAYFIHVPIHIVARFCAAELSRVSRFHAIPLRFGCHLEVYKLLKSFRKHRLPGQKWIRADIDASRIDMETVVIDVLPM